jgi:hypothetical protein
VSGLTLGLSKQQAGAVAFVSLFVTVIGGFLLALWSRRHQPQ